MCAFNIAFLFNIKASIVTAVSSPNFGAFILTSVAIITLKFGNELSYLMKPVADNLDMVEIAVSK